MPESTLPKSEVSSWQDLSAGQKELLIEFGPNPNDGDQVRRFIAALGAVYDALVQERVMKGLLERAAIKRRRRNGNNGRGKTEKDVKRLSRHRW